MINIVMIVGIWTTTCIQTQVSNINQGYTKEAYSIEKDGAFEFKREWYRDSNCIEPMGTETESGMIELGEKLQGLFLPPNSHEANFNTQAGIDQGAINLIPNTSLRISRGVSNSAMRNTMISLFEYKKIK